MTTEIDIKALSKKHGAIIFNDMTPDTSTLSFRSVNQLKAFANEYMALSSSEPVYQVHHTFEGWFDVNLEEYEYAEKAILDKEGWIAGRRIVYLANPINQQLQTERDECVEEIRRLREALQTSHNFISDNYKQPYIKTPEYEGSDCWNSSREALRSTSVSILNLLEK